MRIYNLDRAKYSYVKKSEFKKTTINAFGNIIRALVIEDRWNYCLNDIIEAMVPHKNCGQHVAEWLRRSAWLDCDVFAIDSASHYAKWDDCCDLADAFMYVYRQKLSRSGRVLYNADGSYMKGQTPLPNTVSTEACTYRLWRALLDKAPDAMITHKNSGVRLYRSLDFDVPITLKPAKKPAGCGKIPKSATVPNPVVKSDVLKVTKHNVPASSKQETVSVESVNVPGSSFLDMVGGVSSIVGALVAGKKLKIEISLGE